MAVGRQEAEEECYFYQAVECVFDQICSFGLYVIRYVMFLCFRVQFRTKQTKCFFAYVMLNIICLYDFMFWGMLHCRVGILSCCCIVVLVYCCVRVLSCFDVLLCWCIVLLVYCRVGVLLLHYDL